MPGLRFNVVASFVVVSFDASHMVANQNFFAFHTSQVGFIFFLQPHIANVVAGIVVVVGFHLLGIHLSDVAQKTGAHGLGVVAHNALHQREAREAI